MGLIVEDFRPYDRSDLWRLHHAYFAHCGASAWTGGHIPYLATSSYAMARQHARMLVGLVDELTAAGTLAPGDEVRVLEVGSGLGRFAAHLSRALATDCGEPGRALMGRLRYLLSDYSRKNVSEAIATAPLAGLTRAGRVIPALFDIAKPDTLTDLDGRPLDGPLTAVFANYVCCALPPRVLRKSADGIAEKLVRIGMQDPEDEGGAGGKSASELWSELLENPTRPGLMSSVRLAFSWGPVPPGEAFTDRFHQSVFEAMTSSFAEATVVYPFVFLDFARTLGARMLPGGTLFVSDFGTTRARDLRGLHEATPTVYGNSFSHGVNFSLFEAFCHQADLALLRTRSSLLAVHRAAIRYGRPVTPAFEAAFQRAHLRDGGGQVVLDLRSAGAALSKTGDHKGAVRIYRRSLALDPDSADLCLLLGDACYQAGLDRLALRYLLRGKRLDVRKQHDFDFLLGRVYFRCRRYDDARRAFRRALPRQADAAYVNLGLTYDRLGKPKRARACFRKSLALAPEGENATMARRLLCDLVLRTSAPATPAATQAQPPQPPPQEPQAPQLPPQPQPPPVAEET